MDKYIDKYTIYSLINSSTKLLIDLLANNNLNYCNIGIRKMLNKYYNLIFSSYLQ